MPEQPHFYSVVEAARMLGIGRSVTYQLMASNELVSVKHGKRRLVSAQSVADYATALLQQATVSTGGK